MDDRPWVLVLLEEERDAWPEKFVARGRIRITRNQDVLREIQESLWFECSPRRVPEAGHSRLALVQGGEWVADLPIKIEGSDVWLWTRKAGWMRRRVEDVVQILDPLDTPSPDDFSVAGWSPMDADAITYGCSGGGGGRPETAPLSGLDFADGSWEASLVFEDSRPWPARIREKGPALHTRDPMVLAALQREMRFFCTGGDMTGAYNSFMLTRNGKRMVICGIGYRGDKLGIQSSHTGWAERSAGGLEDVFARFEPYDSERSVVMPFIGWERTGEAECRTMDVASVPRLSRGAP